MAWLVQPVATFTYPLGRQATQAHILSQLQGIGVAVEFHPTSPHAVARCLTLCMNFGLWRCWSEKLELRLEEIAPTQTRVTINAVPNIFRSGVKAGEHVTDIGTLVSALQERRVSRAANGGVDR
jgi:hypothetical protein